MSRRLLVRDQRGERERLLVGTMTVGRDARCDISDADPLLSRRHAEFVCRPDSLLVRDLNSRNGIAVNGVKVQEAVLRPGDVVRVARLSMIYLGDAAVVPMTPSARAPGAERPLREAPQFDSDSTRPITRESAVRTATPVLPLSALAAPTPPVAGPPVEWPPVAGPPPEATPLEDWSLELRPPEVDRPSSHAGAPSPAPVGPVLLGSLSLAIVAFALGAVPTLVWHGRTVESAATAQALLAVRAFAAEAGSALQWRGAAGLGPVTERAGEADGVVSAVVIWADGRVAASVNLGERRVTRIPGLKLPPDAVKEALAGSRDGLIDAAAPVRTSDGPRAAVVWVTVRRVPALPLGMAIVVLGPALLGALLAGSLFAWWLRRRTAGGRPAAP